MSYGFEVVTVGYQRAVRMLKRCAEPGCSTLGFGRMCISHEPKLTRVFVRGRPWPPPEARTPDLSAHADPPDRAHGVFARRFVDAWPGGTWRVRRPRKPRRVATRSSVASWSRSRRPIARLSTARPRTIPNDSKVGVFRVSKRRPAERGRRLAARPSAPRRNFTAAAHSSRFAAATDMAGAAHSAAIGGHPAPESRETFG